MGKGKEALWWSGDEEREGRRKHKATSRRQHDSEKRRKEKKNTLEESQRSIHGASSFSSFNGDSSSFNLKHVRVAGSEKQEGRRKMGKE